MDRPANLGQYQIISYNRNLYIIPNQLAFGVLTRAVAKPKTVPVDEKPLMMASDLIISPEGHVLKNRWGPTKEKSE